MFNKSKLHNFALNKKDFISVSLENIPQPLHQESRKVTATIAPKNKFISKKNVDIDDLFSDVWTKNITPSKKVPVDYRNLDAIQRKISKVTTNESVALDEKLHSVSKLLNKDNKQTISSAEEVNDYLAKIHTLVYKNFNVPSNSEGYSVKTVIVLSALGKLIDFRILTYSDNEALNHEVDNIKNRLKNIVFPLSVDNHSTTTIVILTSQKE